MELPPIAIVGGFRSNSAYPCKRVIAFISPCNRHMSLKLQVEGYNAVDAGRSLFSEDLPPN